MMIETAARVLKAMGEPTRLTILKLLSCQELCICELTAVMDMSQPRISQHVKVLKQAGLLKERRVGQKCYFSLNNAALNGTAIESFRALIQLPLNEIPELAAVNQRFLVLDSNETVQACKRGCWAESSELKRII